MTTMLPLWRMPDIQVLTSLGVCQPLALLERITVSCATDQASLLVREGIFASSRASIRCRTACPHSLRYLRGRIGTVKA